jgi:hypothetical protein
MKFYKIFFLLLIISFYCKAQLPCNRVPDSNMTYLNLNEKEDNINSFRYLVPSCNISEKIKNKILWKLTSFYVSSKESDSFLTKKALEDFEWMQVDVLLQKIANNNDSIYFSMRDSLLHERKLANYREHIKNGNTYFGVSKNTILSSSWLYIDAAKPLLYNALKDKNHKYEKKYVQLSLARFGDKKILKNLISNISIDSTNIDYELWEQNYRTKVAPFLIFAAQQETIFHLHNWLDTSIIHYGRVYSSGKQEFFYSSYLVLNDLSFIIKNEEFQKILKGVNDIWEPINEKIAGVIYQCKMWMIKNKGKYIINPYHCPYL